MDFLSEINMDGWVDCAARCNSTWIQHVDSNVPGGTVIPSAVDAPACQSACLQRPNCTGFDFNPAAFPATARCFLILAADNPTINDGLTKGVTHYERIISCDDNTGTVWNSNYDRKLMSGVRPMCSCLCVSVCLSVC